MYEVLRKYSEDKKTRVMVYYSECGDSPRTWSNSAHFIMKAPYGDSEDVDGELDYLCDKYRIKREQPWLDIVDKLSRYIVIKPICMYSHGGSTVYFGVPTDPWDSGYTGFAYITKDETIECCPKSKRNWRERAEEILNGEMEALGRYVRGDVYGFIEEKLNEPSDEMKSAPEYDEEWWRDNDENWTETDSCWDFYEDADKLADDVLAGAV
jgi:hypothetical protein